METQIYDNLGPEKLPARAQPGNQWPDTTPITLELSYTHKISIINYILPPQSPDTTLHKLFKYSWTTITWSIILAMCMTVYELDGWVLAGPEIIHQ